MVRESVTTMTLVRRFMTMRDVAALPEAEGAAAPSEASRLRSFVASNERVDSYNTIIKASAWERDLEEFKRNPVVLFGHNSRELPIAKGDVRVESGELLLDAAFFAPETNPRSEQVLRVLDEGVMGVSVGFEALEWEYDESRETGDEFQDLFYPPLNYTRVKLLEISVVTLPANGDALPVGRDQVRQRYQARIDAARAAVVSPAPPAPAPAVEPAPPTITDEQVLRLVDEVVKQEVRAFVARKRGSLSGV